MHTAPVCKWLTAWWGTDPKHACLIPIRVKIIALSPRWSHSCLGSTSVNQNLDNFCIFVNVVLDQKHSQPNVKLTLSSMLIILIPSPNKVGYLAQSISYFLFLVFHSLSYKKSYLLLHFFFSCPNGDYLPHEVLNKSVSPKLSFKCFLTLDTQQKHIVLKLISIQIVAIIITLFCLLRMPATIFFFQTNHPHFFKAKLKPQLF